MDQKEKHPKGLYVLFFTEMWERFGFYSMLAMFVLYLRDDKQGFGWSAKDATSLYANYLMFVYASPLIGGWIADKKLGYRNSVLIGGLIFIVGYFLFAIHDIRAVYAALVCLVIGNGFFKPNVSAMVGQLYPEGSTLKDRAYNIFYMGINIGALLAPINAEIWVDRIGFNWAFAIAGLGMIISVAILWTFRHYVEGGRPAQAMAASANPARQNAIDMVPDRTRIIALLVVFLIVIVFWMVFHQNGSTLAYWADDNTNWNVSGIISNAINPFWVVTLTFPVVWMWGWLNRRGMEPATPTKMMIGMFLTACSFAVLYVAAKSGEDQEIRADMYPTGSYRITDRSLGFLKDDGVPDEALKKISETKDKDDKLIAKDKKFKSDTTYSEALETVKQQLKADGMSEGDWTKLKNVKVASEGPFVADQFPGVLDMFTQDAVAAGVPTSVTEKMKGYDGKKFTGEEKLHDAVSKVAGDDVASQFKDALRKRAFLFRVSPLWLFLSYAIVTLGELMLSPMGLSLVSKVAPIHLRGVMMGGWFVATAIGNKLTAIGVYWDRWMQSNFFAVLGLMALAMAIVLLFLLRPLKKAMPGV